MKLFGDFSPPFVFSRGVAEALRERTPEQVASSRGYSHVPIYLELLADPSEAYVLGLERFRSVAPTLPSDHCMGLSTAQGDVFGALPPEIAESVEALLRAERCTFPLPNHRPLSASQHFLYLTIKRAFYDLLGSFGMRPQRSLDDLRLCQVRVSDRNDWYATQGLGPQILNFSGSYNQNIHIICVLSDLDPQSFFSCITHELVHALSYYAVAMTPWPHSGKLHLRESLDYSCIQSGLEILHPGVQTMYSYYGLGEALTEMMAQLFRHSICGYVSDMASRVVVHPLSSYPKIILVLDAIIDHIARQNGESYAAVLLRFFQAQVYGRRGIYHELLHHLGQNGLKALAQMQSHEQSAIATARALRLVFPDLEKICLSERAVVSKTLKDVDQRLKKMADLLTRSIPTPNA